MLTPFLQFDPHFAQQTSPQPARQPYKVVVVQEENHHVRARVFVSGQDWNGDRYLSGTPVTLRWGYLNGPQALFNGYVDHASNLQETGLRGSKTYVETSNLETEVICLGPTWVQKQPQYYIYKNMTIPSVVTAVANQFKLSALTENHPQVWPTLTQHGGETSWDFLVRISSKIGFFLLARSTTILCFSRQGFIDRAFGGGYIPSFSGQPNRLRTLRGQENPHTPYRVEHAQGIDPRTGQIVQLNEDVQQNKSPSEFLGSVTYDPLFDKNDTDISFSDIGTGQAQLQGSALHREFYHQAEISVAGDPTLVAGGVLFLDESYGNRESGYWYIHRVEHHVIIGPNQQQVDVRMNQTVTYFCRLVIGRDSSGIHGDHPKSGSVIHLPGSGSRGRTGGSVHQRRDRRFVIPPSNDPSDGTRILTDPQPPPTVLVDNLWRSAYSQRRCG